jgi:hypothetical protein
MKEEWTDPLNLKLLFLMKRLLLALFSTLVVPVPGTGTTKYLTNFWK